MSFGDTTGELYLVRFDNTGVEYVYVLDRVTGAGTFDTDGNFYWHKHTTTDAFPATLWTIANPDAEQDIPIAMTNIPAGGVSIDGTTNNVTWSTNAADILCGG